MRAIQDAGPWPPIASADAAYARSVFGEMALVRAFEAKIIELSQTKPPQIAGSTHLCAGQEAVALGAVAALRDDDQLLATYRGHAWAIAAGLEPRAVLAEICHRGSGLNGGRGGSAYMMDPGGRFLGENSIVGAGTTIACGVAVANRTCGTDRVVVVSIGDGAMNQGAVHEAMAFAAARRLPVIFVCENNGWSELTPTRDMFLVERLATRARAYGFPSATVDGSDPLAVRDSVSMAVETSRSGEGPVLLEFTVPRIWGHYNRDIEHYRPRQDREAAARRDPIGLLAERLAAEGLASATELESELQEKREQVDALAEEVLAEPFPEASSATLHVVSRGPADGADDGSDSAETKELSYVEAVNAALREELDRDPDTIVYGEDVGKAGGIFGATRYLQRDFGPDRVFDTPIAENAILGSAIGAALTGLRPIVEIMWADFLFVALDQLVNQAANIRYVTQGGSSVPMVVRMQQGATPGSCPQHSQSIEAILAHIPGLKVALAATPQDAYDLIREAAADPDPCIVIESRALYSSKAPVSLGGRLRRSGRARRHRHGADCAIVTWGAMLSKALEAADILSAEGVETTVLDLRWLSPLDDAALVAAVEESGGRVVIAHEAVRTGGFGAEIAMRIHESCGPKLTAPVLRVATPDVRIPASPVLQAALIPGARSIADAVRAARAQ